MAENLSHLAQREPHAPGAERGTVPPSGMGSGLAELGLDINRERFDHKNPARFALTTDRGLTRATVELISKEKNEPEWMLRKRLKALEYFNNTPVPRWGPDLSRLDLNDITYYAKPDAKKNAASWNEVPEQIKKTFERLGIPEAERKSLAGVGTQYESEVIYHNLKQEWEKKGVIFENADVALQKYPELFEKHFMTRCVPINDHKFAMLHAAVWSGGTFIYIPPGVKVTMPLQAYFRMNAPGLGQFEHTLIIADKGAEVSYIEGCFTKGTPIAGNPDYKPIEEIVVGDKVLTHTGTYKRVYHTQVRPYTGYLYTIAIRGNPLEAIKLTEEHPLLAVKRERRNERNRTWNIAWRTPKELRKKDYLVIPRNRVVQAAKSRTFEIRRRNKLVQREVPLKPEFFRLVGYYLAEGSIMHDSYVSFSFGSHERDYIEDVKRCLKAVFGITKLNEIQNKKNHGTSVVVGNVELARIFKTLGTKAYGKQLPPWLMLEDPQKQKEIIIGAFRGDGNYYKQWVPSGSLKEVFRISTTSQKLARQLQELLIRLGVFAFINCRKRPSPRKPIYTVGVTGDFLAAFGSMVGIDVEERLNGRRRASQFFVDDKYAYVPIRSVEKQKVDELPVYNFSVEDDESYVATVAAHNCSAPRYNVNNIHAGCVEIYVHEGARVRYNSVENWSKNTYNLNTKRAIVEANGTIEWINGNMGCLTGDSKVFTNPQGPVEIKDITEGDKVYVWDNSSRFIKKSIVKKKIFSGNKTVYKLEAGGRSIEASGNHPFLTLSRTRKNPLHKKSFFSYEWKPLEQLKVGDLVAITKKIPIEGKPYLLPQITKGKIVESKNQYSAFKMNTIHLYSDTKISHKTNDDVMWLIGLLLGDGHVDIKQNKINLAVHEKDDYREHVCEILKEQFNYTVTERKERYIIINSKVLCELFNILGITGTADIKEVPHWIFTLPRSQILSFLAGYLDSDGHVERGGAYFTSVSKKLLEGVRDLGITVGFGVSKIFRHGFARKTAILGKSCNAKDSWRLLFNGETIRELPSRSLVKKNKIKSTTTRRNFMSARGLNFRSKVNNDIGFATIKKIEGAGVKPTYDIEVEGIHNFIANGFIVHNSAVTMLYPCSVLKGAGARSDFLGIAFAGDGQNQDTGAKVFHLAPRTTSVTRSKSISKDGGINTFRGLLKVVKGAANCKATVQCDALLLDEASRSHTIPTMEIQDSTADIAHEATVGKIGQEQLFYLMSRGLKEEEAMKLIVSGFVEPIVKALPLEYAVELNRLIQLEMDNAIG